MNAGQGASDTFANGTSTRNMTVEAATNPAATRYALRPAGRSEKNTVFSPTEVSVIRMLSRILSLTLLTTRGIFPPPRKLLRRMQRLHRGAVARGRVF